MMYKLKDFTLSNKVYSKCSEQEKETILSELELVEHLDRAFDLLSETFYLYNKAFDLFIEWTVNNDFGYDNLGDLYEQYKEEIECLSNNDGLKYIALKEAEKGIKKMNNEELKPCPFCQGKAFIFIDEEATIDTEGRKWQYQVVCSKCCASTGLCFSEEKAIEYWNRRVGNES